MSNYTYTQNWFTVPPYFEHFLTFGNDTEWHFLEVGSFEGRSAIWFLENHLQHPKSTITCVDPWMDYSQTADSFNTYNAESATYKFGSNKTKDLFLSNITASGQASKVEVLQGLSHEVLPRLIASNRQYDFVYVDGNHTAPFVLTDALLSWYLLKKGGVLYFDDYGGHDETSVVAPAMAINAFLSVFKDYYELIHKKGHVIVRKL